MSQSAFPQSLNIAGGLKRRSVSVRNYRVNIAPHNGSTFSPGQTIKLQIPTISRSFIDPACMAIRFKVKGNGTDYTIDKNAYSFFSRCTQSCSGAVLSDISELNVLTHMLYDLQTPVTQQLSDGALVQGAGLSLNQKNDGAIVNNTEKYFVLPLWSGVNSCDKLLNMDCSSGIEYTFYLESAKNVLRSAGTPANGAAISTYTISEVELIGYVSEISQESAVLLQSSLGGMSYNYFYEDFSHIAATVPANSTKEVHNLAFRYSALSQIIACMRKSSNIDNGNQHSLSNRSKGNLTSYSFFVGGQRMPSTSVRLSDENLGEVVSELQLSYGLYNDVVNSSTLNGINWASGAIHECFAVDDGAIANSGAQGDADAIAAGTFAYNQGSIGSFCFGLDTDGYKSPMTDMVYSGMNTQSASISAELSFANCPAQMSVSYFAKFQCILSLDPTTGSYVSSV